MAALVIVSSQCYLLCEAINYISVDICRDQNVFDDNGDIRYDVLSLQKGSKKKKRYSKKEKEELVRKQLLYKVTINFVAVNSGGNSRNDPREVEIDIQGYDETMKFYKQIV